MAAFQCSKNDWNSENIGKYIDLFEYTLKMTKTCKYFSKHNYEINSNYMKMYHLYHTVIEHLSKHYTLLHLLIISFIKIRSRIFFA